jgi:hypothetical protein
MYSFGLTLLYCIVRQCQQLYYSMYARTQQIIHIFTQSEQYNKLN